VGIEEEKKLSGHCGREEIKWALRKRKN